MYLTSVLLLLEGAFPQPAFGVCVYTCNSLPCSASCSLACPALALARCSLATSTTPR
ncbi:hypothetical protein PF005_g29656 [Phytophthora fragariae]|uniref:4Fe-4S ferredoxin-type domain-containing protein n=1 Tax=Phytophthora fragariae TaxID=53985 RepID=A0A6A3H387_9STRA|nr:hypothetical protein PF003_g31298 [Phytophthora fragariae]KAE8946174.1 hypothetical protein PF009_g4176 [Phytophthora fragariae]KAE8963687.1 hypothetical protein PF011_g28944 [Phytophthora fragariae]KAE9058152.1 hypothetical protein PF010_g31107 [Phytophthora fragariae]KAE9070478.1 hypothetical protein PF006_g29353 [Phytophthora fragariae]